MGLHVADQVVPGKAFNVADGADHRHAHRVVAPDGAVEQFAGAILRILLVLDGLLANHFQLALQFTVGKGAVQDDVGRHAQQLLRVPAQAGHEVAGGVLARERVDIRAQPLRIQVDGLHGAGGGPLERHVLQDMADAVGDRRLVAGADAQEHAHTGALHMGHGNGEQPHPVGKRVEGRGGALRLQPDHGSAAFRLLQPDADAVEREQAQHVPDGHAGLTRFDAADGLDMHAQARGRGGLALPGRRSGQPCRCPQFPDCMQGVVADVCRDALALGHGCIVAAPAA